MAMALTLLSLNSWRYFQLFDTFEGLPEPDPVVDIDQVGNAAADRWREGWIAVGEDEVRQNMLSTDCPAAALQLVKGRVEDTLRDFALPQYALVRLDTDWYASTKFELEVLWPRLAPGGILVIDDYGHWIGARMATDEFFADKPVKMARVDYSCRVIKK